MEWIDYYSILKKYDGDFSRASHSEVVDLLIRNPHNPDDALKIARRIYDFDKKVK
jgi:hypothetical protein